MKSQLAKLKVLKRALLILYHPGSLKILRELITHYDDAVKWSKFSVALNPVEA